MNKTLKIFLPLVFVSVLLGATITQAAYGVTIGEIFIYDVEAASWDMAVDTSSSSGTGFNFLDVKRAVGTQLEVEVTAVSTSSVDWDMTIGEETDSGSSSSFDTLGITLLALFPLLLINAGTITWNQAEMDLGLEIISFFFAELESFGELFYTLIVEDIATYYYTDPNYTFDNIGGTFDDDTNIAVFEWHLDLTYTNDSEIFAGNFVWQYAYDQTDGYMKGNYINMDYSGTINGISISYKFEQRVEEEGYNLPDVVTIETTISTTTSTNASTIPGFEWFIAIPIVTLLGGITIVKRKHKA